LGKAAIGSSCLSVHLYAWNNLALNEWIFMKFDIWRFFQK
jgi:hypothetical protein